MLSSRNPQNLVDNMPRFSRHVDEPNVGPTSYLVKGLQELGESSAKPSTSSSVFRIHSRIGSFLRILPLIGQIEDSHCLLNECITVR